MAQSSVEPMETEESSTPTPIATEVKEFMEFIVNDDKAEVEKFVKNIFGNLNNLAASFQLNGNVDWDGIKRAYEAIDELGYESVLGYIGVRSILYIFKNNTILRLKEMYSKLNPFFIVNSIIQLKDDISGLNGSQDKLDHIVRALIMVSYFFFF